MPVITIDDDHVYRVDGHRKPSVTGIIKSAGLINDQWFNEAAAWRGSVVHKCCELHCKGTLDPASVDPAAQGYLDAWIKFKRNLGFIPTQIEQMSWSPSKDFCGTPDRFGYLGNGLPVVIDLKTGAAQKWHALQLAAYVQFVPDANKLQRFTVQLAPDGEYKMVEYPVVELPIDFAAFLACLTLRNWRKVNNAD